MTPPARPRRFKMIETIINGKYGYRELKNKPTQVALNQYYSEVYKAKKLDKPPEKRKQDNEWLSKTIWLDIKNEIELNNCNSILEIGCGDFALFRYLNNNGFKVVGIKPSCDSLVQDGTIKGDYYVSIELVEGVFDAIIMLNVLEHILKPNKFLEQVLTHLKPGGLFICQVPNDFNILQLATGKPPWWVVRPDHINYFNYKSLRNLVEAYEISPYRIQSDFPMEMYLLAGHEYVGNNKIGEHCHQERIEIESGFGYTERRSLYSLFAKAGIGRNILVFGRYEICDI